MCLVIHESDALINESSSVSRLRLELLNDGDTSIMADVDMQQPNSLITTPTSTVKSDTDHEGFGNGESLKLPPCDQCRRRKVKCDGRKVPCER